MRKYGAKGATDVTGFGLIGHANNLAAYQKNKVDFVIDRLPSECLSLLSFFCLLLLDRIFFFFPS